MWTPTGNGNEIKVDFRLSWNRGRHFCNAATIRSGGLIGEGSLSCFSGCSISQSLKVYCTDFSETDNWSSGRNNFTFTPTANKSSFGFTGAAWISLVAGGSSWSLKTTADLSYRSDTNRINSSPTVEMSPIVTLQHGCLHKIILPVYDADGDNIRCRYAAGAQECAGVCNVFPAILDSTGCTLQYDANGAIGWYAVAVQIEDFLSASSTTPLSSVSLQFLVKVFSSTGSCGSAPVFVSPTPATETCFPISANERFTFTVVAFTNSAASIKSIDTVKNGPSTTSSQFSNSTGRYMRLEATWTPTLSYAGSQAMCFTAVDFNGLRSEMRCVHLYVEAKPNLEDVKKTESDSFIELELIYDKGLERPSNSKYIYIYEANDKLHSTLDSTTANVRFGSSNIRFGLDVDLSTSYYILLDEGVVLGGCKQPAVAITNKTRIVIKRKECPEPPRVIHGTWKVNSTVYGNNASLTCDQGYQLSGDVTLICGANETWQGRQPSCTIIDCGELADVKNGSVMNNGTTYGNTATYRCDTGFDISNKSLITRECTENGTWSGEAPHCIIKDCGDLPGVMNGSVTYRNSTYGETATYTCDTGFNISNTSLITRKCNKDGSWAGKTPHCIIKDCGKLDAIRNGSVTYNGTTYGETATYRCDTGFDISNASLITRECAEDGSWTAEPPHCNIKDCGELAVVKNGSVMYNGTTYGNVATYRCDTGFDISNGNLITRECTENGTWSAETPHCIIKDCGDLPGVMNGSVTYRNTTYGETATYTCDTGFNISNTSLITRKCNKDGNWTGKTPHCIIKDCGKLDAIRNGSVTYHGTTYGETATYRCDTGFDISNVSLITRECADDGSWTAEPPYCNIKDCGELADVKNGSVMYEGTTYGNMATYRCDTGFDISNGNLITRECTENGTWSAETPHCIIKDCGDLPGVKNGSVTYHHTTYSETATYRCDTGFDISNTSLITRKCNKDGNWTGKTPHCIIKDCGGLDALSNGSVTNYGTTYGEKATYRCNKGFDISNDSLITRECGDDGFWSGEKPHCIIKDCGMLPDLKNGSVIYKGTTYGEKATYACDTGFDISDERLITRECTENGTWGEKAPLCIIKVCNTPVKVEFASVTYNETNYMESATYMCNDNYFLSAGNDIRRCEADAHWSGTAPTCTGKFRPGEECLADLTGVSQCLGKEFSCRFDTATGNFRCLCSPELIFSATQEKAICLEKSGYGGKCQIGKQCTPFLSECIRRGQDPGTCGCPSGTKYNETADECSTQVILFCPAGTDRLGHWWNKTRILTTAYQQCPAGSSGQIIRPCLVDGTFSSALYNCTKEIFKNLTTQIQSSNMTTTKALETLQEALSDLKNKSAEIHAGDVDGVETVLTQIVEMEVNETTSVEQLKANAQSFFDIADMLTDPETSGPVWESKVEQTSKGAEKFIETIDRYSLNLATTIASSNETKLTIEKENLVVSVSKVSEDQNIDLKYPHEDELPPFETNRTSSFTLKSDSFSGQTDKITSVVVVVYRNISKALPKTNAQQTSQSTVRTINSQVLSIQLLPKPPKVLNPPIQLTFSIDEHKEGFESHCSFWEPSTDGTTGGWSTRGCERTMANATTVQCSCSHLTNFAILTSPIATPLEHQTALTTISLTGCVVSILCLVVTLILHVTYWRFLKGDRNILAMTVCASLLVAYLLFVFGVTRTTVKGVCTFIAVLLHYTFLLVFFLLLAEGIYMALQVVLPFHKKSHLKELLIGAFAIPAVFVLVVASATDLHGYGNDKYCWLTVDSLAFWMFIGPTTLVIIFNLVIIILIMKKMYGTKWIQDMSQREQAKTLASKTLVMLPVMGVTWLFGILSVHESAIWLQYLFVIFNSFQGFFIFLFHCVLNRQLRAAIFKSRQHISTLSEGPSRSHGNIDHSINLTTITHVEPTSTVTNDFKTDHVVAADLKDCKDSKEDHKETKEGSSQNGKEDHEGDKEERVDFKQIKENQTGSRNDGKEPENEQKQPDASERKSKC